MLLHLHFSFINLTWDNLESKGLGWNLFFVTPNEFSSKIPLYTFRVNCRISCKSSLLRYRDLTNRSQQKRRGKKKFTALKDERLPNSIFYLKSNFCTLPSDCYWFVERNWNSSHSMVAFLKSLKAREQRKTGTWIKLLTQQSLKIVS